MDETYVLNSKKIKPDRITFEEILFNTTKNKELTDNFIRYYSIDDDDIVRLDQSQIIFHEVKNVINNIIDNIRYLESSSSQIKNIQNKRSLESNNEENLLQKKVRFDNHHEEQPALNSLFISETLHSTKELTPSTQFLYNLGFDLCLRQSLNENNILTETQKQILIKHNEVFYKQKIYSCKYCSFKTDTIHVIDRHYRTPHTLSNSNYHNDKYFCTFCLYKTFRLPELRRHFEKKHGYSLITEPHSRRYSCSYCCYENDDKNNFMKHHSRCQIEQERARVANNLLAPAIGLVNDNSKPLRTIKPKPVQSHKQQQQKSSTISVTNTTDRLDDYDIDEPIIIESDHDTSFLSRSSSSDEDFIVSSDSESSSSEVGRGQNDRDLEIIEAFPKKPQKSPLKTTSRMVSQSIPIVPKPTTVTATNVTNLPSLAKLLLLNGAPLSSFTSAPIHIDKPALTPIQLIPIANNNEVYQLCNICQCYIFKEDFNRHIQEKHCNQFSQTRPVIPTPIAILNNASNTIDAASTTSLTPSLVVTQNVTQASSAILLLSTMDPQSMKLDMIKCPWCDTNFEHIDVMTGHLMRYHRMTLAAAKVVVAEQMKIQGSSSNQLSLMFKKEIEQIQKDFTDKIYWKISQPKVYLHQVDSFSCFACQEHVDDVENHFLSSHNVALAILNKIQQCCLCGQHCTNRNVSLFEHQLRAHSGVCYSSVLKRFIRFDPPPPPLSSNIIPKTTNVPKVSSSIIRTRTLTTCTEKKFGCRKCDTGSRLFTFEQLVEHLHSIHKLTVKLHRRCIICQQTFLKGKEYNQHCLEHLKDEYPSVNIKRYRIK